MARLLFDYPSSPEIELEEESTGLDLSITSSAMVRTVTIQNPNSSTLETTGGAVSNAPPLDTSATSADFQINANEPTPNLPGTSRAQDTTAAQAETKTTPKKQNTKRKSREVEILLRGMNEHKKMTKKAQPSKKPQATSRRKKKAPSEESNIETLSNRDKEEEVYHQVNMMNEETLAHVQV